MNNSYNLLKKKIISNSKIDKIIVSDKFKEYKWSQLIKLANQKKKFFLKKKKDCIPIIVDRNVETVTSILGAILAKKTFCTISSKIPKNKLKIILLKLNSSFYLNHSKNNYKLNLTEKIKSNSKTFKEIFYVLFTSGSTGEPKGVKLSYNNIMNTIIWSKKFINWKKNDIIGIATDFSFDISIFDLISGLYFNVPMHILSQPSNPILSFEEINRKKITSIFSVPNFFSNFSRYKIINKDKIFLRRIISGGDFFPKKFIKDWKNNQKHIDIINCWGPTETSIVNTFYKLKKKDYKNINNMNPIPVGKSNRMMPIVILKNNVQVKKNYIGEICMLGKCVCEGYVNNDNSLNNFIKYKKKRGYLTKDLGYFDKNNFLYITGRIDNMIKISGYRIDGNEIQNLTNKIKNINNSIAFAIRKKNYINELCLAVETFAGKNIINEIRKRLIQYLPSYSLPKKILLFKKFPVNINNKIDRNKIKKKFTN